MRSAWMPSRVLFQAVFEGGDVGVAALARGGATMGQQEILPGVDGFVHGKGRAR